MRLFMVELRRLAARRMFKLLSAGVVLFMAFLVGATAWNSQPPTEEELEFAREELALVQEQMQQDVEFCEENPADYEVEDADECAEMIGGWQPTVEDFTYSSTFSFADEIRAMSAPIGGALFVFAFVVGVSFIGAEWNSGMMGTHLTWEPRRGRVLASKTAAVAVAVAVIAAILFAASVAGLYWVADTWGTTDRTTSELVTDLTWRGLRITGLAAALGALGVALAGTLRSTVGALVTLAAYLAVAEGIIRGVWQGSDRWLITHNVAAWLDDGIVIDRWTCPRIGGDCTNVATEITLAGGAAVLGGVILAAIALHTVTFLRRDVV